MEQRKWTNQSTVISGNRATDETIHIKPVNVDSLERILNAERENNELLLSSLCRLRSIENKKTISKVCVPSNKGTIRSGIAYVIICMGIVLGTIALYI